MHFKDLKLSISLHFAILLAIAMLLLNVVITSFWQKHIAVVSMNEGRGFLTALVENRSVTCEKKIVELEEYQKKSADFDADFVLYNEGSLIGFNQQNDQELLRLLRKSIQFNKEVTGSIGNYWSLFGISAKDIVIARPIENCQKEWAAGVVIHMSGFYRTIFEKQSIILVYLLVNVIILTTIGFFRMRKLIVKPLEDLVKMSETYTSEVNDFLAIAPRNNEFGHVSLALHNMLSRIEKDKQKLNETIRSLEKANKQILDNQKDLIEAEKFAAVGKLAAGLAHEIGNPLGIIQGYLELLGRKDISEEEREQYTLRSSKELDRVNDLIRQLLGFSRKKQNDNDRTAITPVISEVLALLRHQKTAQDIDFVIESKESDIVATIGTEDLHQVVLNCILNAMDAIQEIQREGQIKISTRIIQIDNEDFVEMLIVDNGPGINEKISNSVFEPFFTTKDIGHGTGLGLSVSRSIVEKSGGRMHIESDGINGACVTILLPLEEDQRND